MGNWKKQTAEQGAGCDPRQINHEYKLNLERWPSLHQERKNTGKVKKGGRNMFQNGLRNEQEIRNKI